MHRSRDCCLLPHGHSNVPSYYGYIHHLSFPIAKLLVRITWLGAEISALHLHQPPSSFHKRSPTISSFLRSKINATLLCFLALIRICHFASQCLGPLKTPIASPRHASLRYEEESFTMHLIVKSGRALLYRTFLRLVSVTINRLLVLLHVICNQISRSDQMPSIHDKAVEKKVSFPWI